MSNNTFTYFNNSGDFIRFIESPFSFSWLKKFKNLSHLRMKYKYFYNTYLKA